MRTLEEVKKEFKYWRHLYYQPMNRKISGKPTSEAFNEIYIEHILPLEKEITEIISLDKK